MQSVIQGYLDKVKVGRKQSHRNLAFFPLLSGYPTTLDYMTLEGGHIEVTEVSEGGTVPELKVVNKSPRMVLILDGEELVGAKQNRIVNTTILTRQRQPARATLLILGKLCLPKLATGYLYRPERWPFFATFPAGSSGGYLFL